MWPFFLLQEVQGDKLGDVQTQKAQMNATLTTNSVNIMLFSQEYSNALTQTCRAAASLDRLDEVLENTVPITINKNSNGRTNLTFDEALNVIDKSGLRPGQTEVSKSRVMTIVNNYDPIKAQSSVYTDSTGKYLVEGHHTTVANTMLGKGSGINMNTPTQQMPSATNVYWTKNWYEFWKTALKITK